MFFSRFSVAGVLYGKLFSLSGKSLIAVAVLNHTVAMTNLENRHQNDVFPGRITGR